MFTITESNQDFFLNVQLRKGSYSIQLPIRPDGGIIFPSGCVGIYRPVINPTYVEVKDGIQQVNRFVPTLQDYIMLHLSLMGWMKQRLLKAEGMGDPILPILESALLTTLNRLYKSQPEWGNETGFEDLCQSQSFVTMVTEKRPRTEFAVDSAVQEALGIAESLQLAGLSRPCATQPGFPGKSFDKVNKFKYTAMVNIEPFAELVPNKRFTNLRGLSHLLPCVGADKPYVRVKEAGYVLPPMVNLHVCCMPMDLQDSIVISETAARKLAIVKKDNSVYDIDELINSQVNYATSKKGYAYRNYVAPNKNQPVSREFSNGLTRQVGLGGKVTYRKQTQYIVPVKVGQKIQSQADLFKGVVAKILPDDKMPRIKYVFPDGTYAIQTADVICEMGYSTKKHCSLKLAQFTMVLNRIAQVHKWFSGEPLEVSHEKPWTQDQLLEAALEVGYTDESLRVEILARKNLRSNEQKSLGFFPAGIIRVGVHRQRPDVNGAVFGAPKKHTYSIGTRLRFRGVKEGFIDTMVKIACGFKQCAKEYRKINPLSIKKLEVLRKIIKPL